MSSLKHRRSSSFWVAWSKYLLGELRALALTLALCAILIFLAASLLVGMFQIVQSLLLLVITV